MGKLTPGSILVPAIAIFFIFIFAYVLPQAYNTNLEKHTTHSDYCSLLRTQMSQDRAHNQTQLYRDDAFNYKDQCS